MNVTVRQVIVHDLVVLPILDWFSEVVVQNSTMISLLALATQFGWLDVLVRTLTTIMRYLRATRRTNARKKCPTTDQRFLQATAS
ncbi:hypothetical protein [Candidatus Chloroploca sp. Khr17]|uniref:hypothetical protein n=1 Tax=Candidatus Chloroploca sp. Khr17 TaxID=2496869 RepID=UPI00101CD30E|nr:hypothetical protein [Candidatus Chloroploca sp. Khr17]